MDWPRIAAASGSRASPVISASTTDSGRNLAQAGDPPLGVVGNHDLPGGRPHERLVGLRLKHVRRRESVLDGHAVHTQEEDIDMELAQGGQRQRPHERIGYGPDSTREDDVLAGVVGRVEGLGNARRVCHHRQVVDARALRGKRKGGGARIQGNGHARLHHCGRRGGYGLLFGRFQGQLVDEPRLPAGGRRIGCRPAVHLDQGAAGGQQTQVTSHGHLRNAQLTGQRRHAHLPMAVQEIKNSLVSRRSQHLSHDRPVISLSGEHQHPSDNRTLKVLICSILSVAGVQHSSPEPPASVGFRMHGCRDRTVGRSFPAQHFARSGTTGARSNMIGFVNL